jgi:UDP-glucose 4-epimerase
MRGVDSELAKLAADLSGRRVLITGGLGFLGSNLAHLLVNQGVTVAVVDALLPGHGGLRRNLEEVADQVEVEIGDIRDEELMRRLVAGCDLVFSFAGQTSHVDSMADPYADLEHNCRAQLALLEACRQVAPETRLVFASTRQLYGRVPNLPVDEAQPVQPVDVNGINKWAGEAYHLLYGEVYGLRVSALRLTNTYGPRMRVLDARQTFLGLWIRLLLTGQELQVYGDGEQRRDFTYVDDALHAFLLSAVREEAIGRVLNLGDQRTVSLRELAEMLIKIHGSGSFRMVSFPEDRKAIDIGDYQGDYGRIRGLLGWTPAVPLEEGLERTLAYFSEHGVDS